MNLRWTGSATHFPVSVPTAVISLGENLTILVKFHQTQMKRFCREENPKQYLEDSGPKKSPTWVVSCGMAHF